MHSDGYILELYDDLIEIGVDAINSQVWCMGLDKVSENATDVLQTGAKYVVSTYSPKEVSKM